MRKYWFCWIVLVLGLVPCARGQDCVSKIDPYLANGTTAHVTIYNGSGGVSYAYFHHLNFKAAHEADPASLDGMATQLFNDRKYGAQAFDANQSDKLEIVVNRTSFQGKPSGSVAFVLLSWGNKGTTYHLNKFSCPGTGYFTVLDDVRNSLYIIEFRN